MAKRSAWGSIQPVREGVCRIQWTEGGRRRTATVYGSRQDAARELARLQVEAEGVTGDMLWGDYWEWRVVPSFAHDGLERRTVDDYESTWQRLSPLIAQRWVSQTTPRMVEGTLAKLTPGQAVKAARLWRKMCRMAVGDGALSRDPFVSVRVKVPRKAEKRLLAAEEVAPWMALVEGAKAEPVLLCELGGGLRHEEACALTWEDVSEWAHDGRVYAVLSVSKALVVASTGKLLKETKTAFSGREVVLGEPFASRLLALRGTGALSPSGHGGGAPEDAYASPQAVTRNYKLWCERRGADYVRPAWLRSTFATLHGECGSPDSLVSMAMGHADGTTKARNYQAMTRRGGALIADNLAEHLAKFADGTQTFQA